MSKLPEGWRVISREDPPGPDAAVPSNDNVVEVTDTDHTSPLPEDIRKSLEGFMDWARQEIDAGRVYGIVGITVAPDGRGSFHYTIGAEDFPADTISSLKYFEHRFMHKWADDGICETDEQSS